MLTLTDEMLLYHGSFTRVSEIDLNKCKRGKDFGRGFYVTSSYQQAQTRLGNDYLDQKAWTRKEIINVAKSGVFSSDRTIEEYNEKIWHLPTLTKKK